MRSGNVMEVHGCSGNRRNSGIVSWGWSYVFTVVCPGWCTTGVIGVRFGAALPDRREAAERAGYAPLVPELPVQGEGLVVERRRPVLLAPPPARSPRGRGAPARSPPCPRA